MDTTAIIFFQESNRPGEWNVIDYYEARDQGIEHYVSILRNRGYNYGRQILPHDAFHSESNTARKMVAGAIAPTSVATMLNQRGFYHYEGANGKGVPRTSNQESDFWVAKEFCGQCNFNTSFDSVRTLFERLKSSSREEANGIFLSKIKHDNNSHAYKAFECAAKALSSISATQPLSKEQIQSIGSSPYAIRSKYIHF